MECPRRHRANRRHHSDRRSAESRRASFLAGTPPLGRAGESPHVLPDPERRLRRRTHGPADRCAPGSSRRACADDAGLWPRNGAHDRCRESTVDTRAPPVQGDSTHGKRPDVRSSGRSVRWDDDCRSSNNTYPSRTTFTFSAASAASSARRERSHRSSDRGRPRSRDASPTPSGPSRTARPCSAAEPARRARVRGSPGARC